MCTLDIFDTLELTDTTHQGGEVAELKCRWAAGSMAHASRGTWGQLPPPEENLAMKALRLLGRQAGEERSAQVSLVKRIPAAAGLGGASSNAAAALAAANIAWNLHWPVHRLAETAAEIGSDVPFFLYGGAAVVGGRGERIEPLAASPGWPLVVVKPAVGLSTAEVYRQCAPADQDIRGVRGMQPLLNAIASQREDRAANSLWNRLQETAEQLAPAVAQALQSLRRAGAAGCLMSGSGSSVFGLCRSTIHARRVAAQLRQQLSGATFAARLWRSPRRAAAA